MGQMNNNAKYILIVVTAFLIALTGCRTLEKNLGIIEQQVQRQVENNIFSSSFPEIKLQVNNDFKYLGSAQLSDGVKERVSFNADPGEKILDVTSYLFGKVDTDNRILKGVLIRILVMHGDPSQVVPEFFSSKKKNALESGEMKILEDVYHYDLFPEPALFADKEKSLISSGEFPSCFLVKRLSVRAGLGNKSRIQIL
jgi:hypothetical protein